MKKIIIISTLILSTLGTYADESLTEFINDGIESTKNTSTKVVHYKDQDGRLIDLSEQRKLEVMRPLTDKKRVYVPNTTRRSRINESFALLSDDKRVVTITMSVNDVIKTQMCYNSPLRIAFDPLFEDKMGAPILDDSKVAKAQVLEDKRSVLVSMNEAAIIKADEVWRTGIRIVRASDSRAYYIQIDMIACPEGDIDFPREIIIKDKGLKEYKDSTMLPEDFISTLTYGLPRVNNENPANVYGGLPTENANWVLLGVSIKIRNPLRAKAKFEFIVLDNQQLEIINSDVKFIPTSSMFASDTTGIPTLRYNIMVNVNKKYAIEKDIINLLIIDHDEKTHQHLKIRLKNLYFEKGSLEGYELNLK